MSRWSAYLSLLHYEHLALKKSLFSCHGLEVAHQQNETMLLERTRAIYLRSTWIRNECKSNNNC